MIRIKFSAPVIAILVVISGVCVGALLRSKQHAAPVPPLITSQSSGLPRHEPPGATSVVILEHRYSIPLRGVDIDETVEAPSIVIDESGTVYVAWASKTADGEHALTMSRSETAGRTWLEPWQVTTSPIHVAVTEMRGRRIERRVRLMPLLATHEKRLYLSWVRGGKDRSDVALLLATSDDQGRTFSEPIRVHENDQARPTFTSMAVSRNGDVACSWLDNRNEVQQCFMAVKPSDQEKFLPEMLVDPGQNGKGICPCCPTSVAFAPDHSAWVAFRGHVDGMRDMWTARWQPGHATPSPPMPSTVPTWKFDGCPHDGPALVAMKDRTTVAWMDSHQGMSRVFVNQLTPVDQSAANGSGKWNHAVAAPVDGNFSGTQEQPCLAVDSSNAVIHAAWSASESHAAQPIADSPAQPLAFGQSPISDNVAHDHTASVDSRRVIRYATSGDGGKTFSPSMPVASQDDAFQSRVKLVVGPESQVYVAYFELSSEGKRLIVGRIQPSTQVTQATNATKPSAAIAGVTP